MTELRRLCWAAVDTAAGGVGDQIRTLPGPDGPSVDSVGAGHPVISNVMVSNSTITYLRGSSSACGPAQGELDAAVFRAALRSIVGRNRISLTVPDRGYKAWLHAFRDQILHNVLGAPLRQNLV
jgi:hypothetical protein